MDFSFRVWLTMGNVGSAYGVSIKNATWQNYERLYRSKMLNSKVEIDAAFIYFMLKNEEC